eukprot:6195986-Pleurochrysis_carterae.AAC.2
MERRARHVLAVEHDVDCMHAAALATPSHFVAPVRQIDDLARDVALALHNERSPAVKTLVPKHVLRCEAHARALARLAEQRRR